MGELMKVISFSAVEVLPRLLDKTKTQTIRPLLIESEKSIPNKHRITFDNKEMDLVTMGDAVVERSYKKPRFKVGEHVQLMWKCRSKAQWFCRTCGSLTDDKFLYNGFSRCEKCFPNYMEVKKPWVGGELTIQNVPEKLVPVFSKLLGTAEITEVFEIEMQKYSIEHIDGERIVFKLIKYLGEEIEIEELLLPVCENGTIISMEDFAKRDGFKSAEDMIAWFDKQYDLSQPRRFAVYRFRWL